MFTGFPAVVAVSQNITVATPSEAYFPQASYSIAQTISSNSVLPILESLPSTLQSSTISSVSTSSSSVVSSSIPISSIEEKPKVVEVETKIASIIVVQPISSASRVMSDIKKVEVVQETPKQVFKQETKIENKVNSPVVKETKPIVKTEDTKPTIITSSSATTSVSSIIESSSSSSISQISKANMTFSEQIVARCEVVGCNAKQLIRVMKCESSGNPTVVGAGLYVGLFQFLPSTFNAYKIKAGLPNGDIYNGSDQIHVASYMFASGQASQWGCK